MVQKNDGELYRPLRSKEKEKRQGKIENKHQGFEDIL